jgi:hypothetical protein
MNLFIVESPFQFLSAIEANNHFSNEDNILIIRYSNGINNNKQLSRLKEFIDWGKIFEIKNEGSAVYSSLKLLFLIVKIKKQYPEIDKILIGEYRSWIMREYFNLLDPIKCFTLDDGSITIELAKSYIDTGKEYSIYKRWKALARDAIRTVFRVCMFKSLKKRIDINLFTCFDVDDYIDKKKLTKHSFEYIKRKNSDKLVLKNIVYFFGGNISELGIITQEEEIDRLIKINDYYNRQDIKLIYLPHRKESYEKIKIIEKSIKAKILHLQYPAEIEFILMSEIPQYIGSFMSSALFTVSKIMEFKEVTAFQIEYEIINPPYLPDIVSVYESYRKSMKLINLN